MRRHTVMIALILALTLATGALALGCNKQGTVSNGFVLYTPTEAATVFVAQEDAPQVHRAVRDLQADVRRVTGGAVDVSTDAPHGRHAVIVGTVGKNATIDALIASGKLDEARSLSGKWEAYAVKLVDKPCEGVDKALVIAGSDARGTIYGTYTVSEMIGVSPWYFMADVTTERRSSLRLSFAPIVADEPSVKYRGIFLNDEYNFTTWAKQYATDGSGAPNAEVYGRVFELLLRLKANTLWPGMHGVSTGFYVKKNDQGISINASLANDYGVVIGTSHCEQFLRNNVAEWQVWADANKNKYGLPDTTGWAQSENPYAVFETLYDYSLYPDAIAQYWYERLVEAKGFESLITIGMRGVHDEGFQYKGLADKSFPERVKLLQSVIDRQLELVEAVYGEDWQDEVQLVYIPYKEAADYYYGTEGGVDYGTKITLPESTLLMWAEDNYGYLRQTPDPDELITQGGYGNMGIYYHLSYVGVPCVWIWTDLMSHGTTYSEMRKAYDTGANGCWIVNVGDIKPAEYGMEYFLQLGYDVDRYDDTQYKDFMAECALRDFTQEPALAARIASLVVDFKQCAETYRADFAGKSNMQSLSATLGGDEALCLVARLEAYCEEANAIYCALPAHKRDAFWQTVAYAIRGEYFAVKRVVYAERTQVYYAQGRFAAASWYGAEALSAQDALDADVDYYNLGLSDGKWYGMANEYIGGAYYGLVTREELENLILRVGATYGCDGVGAVCEGQEACAEGGTLEFSSVGKEERFIDVYSLGNGSFDYTVTSPDWIRLTARGSVATEERLVVTVDWGKLTESATGTVTVTDGYGHRYDFTVRATLVDETLEARTYYATGGVVSIEAEHYHSLTAGADGTEWREVQGLGRSGSSMKVTPDTVLAPTVDFDTTARVTYRIWVDRAGVYNGTLYRIPTLNESGAQRLAIGLTDRTPTVLEGAHATGSAGWSEQVMERIDTIDFAVILKKGYNELTVYRIDPFVAFDKLVLTAQGVTDDTYYGLPESFNTVDYGGTKVAALPTPDTVETWTDTAATHDKFSFGTQDAMTGEYVHVSATNGVFDATKGFGFATEAQARNVTPVYRTAVKSSEERASFVYGTGAARFSMRVENGRYNVVLVMGDYAETGYACTTTLSVNGSSVLSGASLAAGAVREYSAVVTATDGRIDCDLDGSWVLNAIELYPYEDMTAEGGAFIVDGDGGYLEAESALEQSQYAYTTLSTVNQKEWTRTGGVSGDAVMAGPDNGKNHSDTARLSGCGLHYEIYFETGGEYWIWALAKLASADDDSMHIVWDGEYLYSYNPSSRENGFAWAYLRVKITAEAGSTHTLSLYQREDGLVLDKLFFSAQHSSISGGKSVCWMMPRTEEREERVALA